jgi:CheY-like chemotaxis protein
MSDCPTKHVLFLDDDRDFLDTLESLIPATLRRSWCIHRTDDPAYALVLLREHPIKLVVTDLSMPVLDGLQFLQLLHQVCPLPRKVVLTSIPDPDFRQACLSRGAALYLVKPASAVAFVSTFNLLEELMEWPVEPGFSGTLRRVQLPDVVQLECMTQASSVLLIRSRTVQGSIYIEDGRVVHAETEARQGENAFMELVNLDIGEFDVTSFTAPAARTIHESCHSLLLGAAQHRDEGGFGSPDPTVLAEIPLASIPAMVG